MIGSVENYSYISNLVKCSETIHNGPLQHAEQLRSDRETNIIIDENLSLGDCEGRIEEYRVRIGSQQELVKSRREEAVYLRQAADRCRGESNHGNP